MISCCSRHHQPESYLDFTKATWFNSTQSKQQHWQSLIPTKLSAPNLIVLGAFLATHSFMYSRYSYRSKDPSLTDILLIYQSKITSMSLCSVRFYSLYFMFYLGSYISHIFKFLKFWYLCRFAYYCPIFVVIYPFIDVTWAADLLYAPYLIGKVCGYVICYCVHNSTQ